MCRTHCTLPCLPQTEREKDVNICTYTYICIYMIVCTCIYIHINMPMDIYYTHIYIFIFSCTYLYFCIHMYVHTNTHTYICIHAHLYTSVVKIHVYFNVIKFTYALMLYKHEPVESGQLNFWVGFLGGGWERSGRERGRGCSGWCCSSLGGGRRLKSSTGSPPFFCSPGTHIVVDIVGDRVADIA